VAKNRRNKSKQAELWFKTGLHLRRGSRYEPFILVRESGNLGWRNHVKSWTCDRAHDFLSQNEYHLFLLLDSDPRVTDIREQYPLLPVADTEAIANGLGVKHSENGQNVVYTTDFFITFEGRDIALYFKNTSDLSKRRTIEKLMIERSYWRARDVPFYVVTEKNLNFRLARSIDEYHKYRHEEFNGITAEDIRRALYKIQMSVILDSDKTLAVICAESDELFNFSGGQSLALVKRELANQRWYIRPGTYFSSTEPLKLNFEARI